jgi:phosphohistidine swiveling domain-containing protein
MGEVDFDRWLADWPPSTRWPSYTRANSGEVLPTPASPLGQQFSWERGICQGWADGYARSGSYSRDEFDERYPDTVGFFGGYMYINLSNVRMQGVRSPVVTVEQLDLAFFGDHPDVPVYRAHPADERADLTDGVMAHLGWVMTTTQWDEIDREREETKALRRSRPDFATASDAELVAYARSSQPMLRKLFESHTISSSSSGIAPGILFQIGQAIGDATIPMKLLAGIGDVDSAEPSYAMWDLSRLIRGSATLSGAFDAGVEGLVQRLASLDGDDVSAFLAAFDEFLVEFGSRGPNEWEISSDTWETRPEIALAAIDRVRFQSDKESPRLRNRARATEREQLTGEVRIKVAALGEELAGQFEAALVAAHQLAFRERTKTNIIRAVHEGRMVFRELGRRHHETGQIADPDHVFMLLNRELEDYITHPGAYAELLAERYRRWVQLWELEPPFFIVDGQVPPLRAWTRKGQRQVASLGTGDSLQGVPGCPGSFEGRARVVLDPADPGDLEPGDVLVSPLTDPAWTPLFMAVGAVVVNVGGQISHAIIVSRELGLPCVVSATDATYSIPDGAHIRVDGDTGVVTILEVSA